jgi:zinc protease
MRNARSVLSLLLICGLALAQENAKQVIVQQPGELPSPGSLVFPPLSPVKIPKPTTFVLPNGLKIFFLENHELPVVRGTMMIRTGNLFDPKEKRGLATLTGVTLRSGGTSTLTGDQIDERLESVAASIESEIGESSGTVRFRCLKDNLKDVLPMLGQIVSAPAFREDKLQLAKLQLKSAISRRNDDAAGIGRRELERLVYGPDTPYGGLEEYATVDAVQRADVEAFYKRYYFPSNILMSVYGDFSTAEMQAKLEALLGSWKNPQVKVPPFPPVEATAKPGLFFVQKPDVEQTFLNFGELGGELRDKDYPALSVAADVLGGGFSSRLLREVRSRLGYAYSVSAGWDANFDHPGLFRINSSTKASQTTEAIAAILRQIESMRTNEVSDEELKTAKDAALNSLIFAFERPSSTLGRLMTYEYFAYPADFLDRYQRALTQVTKADVLRVAKEHFSPSKLTIVAVGNQALLGQPLSTLKIPVTPLEVTIPGMPGTKEESH